MQNAAPLQPCSRESWTKRYRAAGNRGVSQSEMQTWPDCSLAIESSSKSPGRHSHWSSARASGSMEDLQSSGRRSVEAELKDARSQMFCQFNPASFQRPHNLYDNAIPAMERLSNGVAATSGTDIAWPTPAPPYCNMTPPANGVVDGFNHRAFNEEEFLRLINARTQELNAECYTRAQTFGSDSLTPGNGSAVVKMHEITSSSKISSKVISLKPSFQCPDFTSFCSKPDIVNQPAHGSSDQHQDSADTVNESSSVLFSDNLHQKSAKPPEETEDAAPEKKRTSSVIQNGDNAGPGNAACKRARTSDASLKVNVKKEKLGERITALQQLVSPFGKTDTASVLLEAIGYIRFLQDQVQVLSTPYLKGIPAGRNREGKGNDSAKCDLRSRGLCVMPLSSTQHVANNNGADFWASGIGGNTRL